MRFVVNPPGAVGEGVVEGHGVRSVVQLESGVVRVGDELVHASELSCMGVETLTKR